MAARASLSRPGDRHARPALRHDQTADERRGRAARTPAAAGPRGRSGSAIGRYLLWSDIPNNRILRWDEETGEVSVFRKPSNYANGNTRDRQGRLVTCEHGGRQVTRTEHDGTITVLIARRVRGQAAQLAERRRRQIRRLDVVHRPDLRHPRQLRGPQGASRNCR